VAIKFVEVRCFHPTLALYSPMLQGDVLVASI
jgi:hypothetical protein